MGGRETGRARLWQQLDEERRLVEARLVGRPHRITTNPASLVSMTNNQAFTVEFEDGKRAIWKPAAGAAPAKPSVDHKTYHLREAAAFRMDRLMGMGRVPTTVIRTIDGESGSLQTFVVAERMSVGSYTKVDIARMGALDYVLGSLDRHLANFRTDNDGRPAATDNGCCLPRHAGVPLLSHFTKPILHQPLPAAVVAELHLLDPALATDILRELVIEEDAIKGFLDRLAEARTGTITGTAWPGIMWPPLV
jgi:hypothetical protein